MNIYKKIRYTPKEWRETQDQPDLPQGVIVGCNKVLKNQYAMVATDDVHTMMIGAAGCGKTAYWLYPNLEYACASGLTAVARTSVFSSQYLQCLDSEPFATHVAALSVV